MLGHAIHYIKKNTRLLFLIGPAFLLHMLIMMPSGTDFCLAGQCGLHFWGINSHDAMWHLEIVSASFHSFPFQVPTFAGATLSGYNVLMDLGLYVISFLGIPPIVTLFKIIPPIWFVFYTLIGISLARSIKDDRRFVAFFLFALYFADHFGYLLHLYHDGSIFKGAQSFSLQSLTSQLNTQFALTLPIIMFQLILIKKKMFQTKYLLMMAVSVFFVLGLKFYGGVISGTLAGFYLIEAFIDDHKFKDLFKRSMVIGIFAILCIILFYNPFAAEKSGAIFTISPFATVHSMIEAPDMVYLPNMVNARYYLYEQGFSPKILYIEGISTLLYFIFNFGTRVFGIFYILVKICLKKASRFEWYVLFTVLVAFTLNVMLIQKGNWWNTVQFGYYGIFLSSIFLAQLLYDLSSKGKRVGIFLASIIMIITIPNNLRTINTFFSLENLYIPRAEIETLSFLNDKPDGVVFHSFKAAKGYPFLDYVSSGYVAAFTGKQVYYGHLGGLIIVGVDWAERDNRINEKDCSMFSEIKYIYFVKKHSPDILNACKVVIKRDFSEVFKNSEVKIYEKKR